MDSFMKEFEHLRISLDEIKRVTDNFRNKPIGFGGFGKVYEGELSHSKGRNRVAIKRLDPDTKSGQGNPEFGREIMMLSRYSHENLISLLGFCDEDGEKVIVTELASNGSLDRYLSSPDLTWVQRIKICLGAAQGLCYLHVDKGMHQRVIHRDVKSSNILLDDEWKAKVSDMGLAKLGPANQEHTALLTRVVGTLGYLDPVYLEEGVLTKESDVYSFGVVLFEVLCGRLCFISNRNGNLVRTWKQSYIDEKIHEIIFKDPRQPLDMDSLKIFSEIAFRCVQKSREERPTMSDVVERLEMALQFQKQLDLKLPKEYVNILKAVATPLRYKSLEELRLLLSNGHLLDAGKTWFSINDKGEHTVLISMDECLIREEGKDYEYSTRYNSRFPVGTYSAADDFTFLTRVKTRFLSPNITYTVNLVFKKRYNASDDGFKRVINLTYKLCEETEARTPHLADEREDGWYTIELYQFTCDGTPVDLDIVFEVNDTGLELEGIEFQPMENGGEGHVSDDEKQVDIQPSLSYPDHNSYREQKLPNDYQEIIKLSKDIVEWKTKEELYSIFCKGFLINHGSFFEKLFNNGEQWFFLDKNNGKKCLMLSARAAFKVNKIKKSSFLVFPKVVFEDGTTSCIISNRFNELLWVDEIDGALFQCETKRQLLSLQTKYACYLVYQINDNYESNFQRPVSVRDRYVGSKDWDKSEYWHIYLVRPQTPVIRPKVGENTHNPLSRPKIKGLPQQRSDSWMEVQVYEFQTTDTTEGVIPSLEVQLKLCVDSLGSLHLHILGVEFRPISIY